MTTIFQCPVRLLQLKVGVPVELGRNTTVRIVQHDDFSSVVEVSESDRVLVSFDVSSALNVQFRSSDYVVFFDVQHSMSHFNISLLFGSLRPLRTFMAEFTRSLFEFAGKHRANESDRSDLDRFLRSYSLDLAESDLPDEATFADTEYEATGASDGGRNTLLRLIRPSDQALVLRRYQDHCDLGLFDLDIDCTFRKAVPSVAGDDRRPILASDMITFRRDRSLLLLDDSRRPRVFDLNLTRGGVVDRYDVDAPAKSCRLIDLGEVTFLTFTPREIMLFDSRTSRGAVQRSEYRGNCEFTCGATTESGRVAMGSSNGVVRLYREPCKSRATMNFQTNCGAEPIIGIDISPDEQWVVATCPYYLSVFNVYAHSTGKLGFDVAMGKDRPALVRLAIRPEHLQKVARGNEMPAFAPAKFEVKKRKIVAVVAAIGNALLTWDFRRISEGALPTYSIKVVGAEAIVDDQPLFTSNDLVFISDNQVAIIERAVPRR
jgi:hypothetical protein